MVFILYKNQTLKAECTIVVNFKMWIIDFSIQLIIVILWNVGISFKVDIDQEVITL